MSLSQIVSGWCGAKNRAMLGKMSGLIKSIFFGLVRDLFRSPAALEAEILVLRQQIIVLQRVGLVGRLFPNTCDAVCTEN